MILTDTYQGGGGCGLWEDNETWQGVSTCQNIKIMLLVCLYEYIVDGFTLKLSPILVKGLEHVIKLIIYIYQDHCDCYYVVEVSN